MKIEIKVTPTMFQKKIIKWSTIYLLAIFIFILWELPSGVPQCLQSKVAGPTTQYVADPDCIQRMIDSITLIQQLTFITKTLALSGIFLSLVIGLACLHRWTYKVPK